MHCAQHRQLTSRLKQPVLSRGNLHLLHAICIVATWVSWKLAQEMNCLTPLSYLQYLHREVRITRRVSQLTTYIGIYHRHVSSWVL